MPMFDLDPFAEKEEPAPPKPTEVKKEKNYFGMLVTVISAVCATTLLLVTYFITHAPK